VDGCYEAVKGREMSAIQVSLVAIMVVEILSVLELYFLQDRCIFNGVAMFKVCVLTRKDPELFGMVRYLVNWIAGVKLIVIGLLGVIVFTSPENTIMYAAISLVITIASFFWRMFPAVRLFDDAGLIEPAGRARVLGWMVFSLELILVASILLEAYP
jgi:hypothetical protein